MNNENNKLKYLFNQILIIIFGFIFLNISHSFLLFLRLWTSDPTYGLKNILEENKNLYNF